MRSVGWIKRDCCEDLCGLWDVEAFLFDNLVQLRAVEADKCRINRGRLRCGRDGDWLRHLSILCSFRVKIMSPTGTSSSFYDMYEYRYVVRTYRYLFALHFLRAETLRSFFLDGRNWPNG